MSLSTLHAADVEVAPRTFGATSGNQQHVSVADGRSSSLAVWEDVSNPNLNGAISMRLLNPSGAPLGETQTSIASGVAPAVVFDGTNYVIAYSVLGPRSGVTDPRPRLIIRRVDEQGHLLGEAHTLYSSTDVRRPSIAAALDGDRVVFVFSDQGSIHTLILFPDGSTNAAQVVGTGSFPHVAVRDGRIVAGWALGGDLVMATLDRDGAIRSRSVIAGFPNAHEVAFRGEEILVARSKAGVLELFTLAADLSVVRRIVVEELPAGFVYDVDLRTDGDEATLVWTAAAQRGNPPHVRVARLSSTSIVEQREAAHQTGEEYVALGGRGERAFIVFASSPSQQPFRQDLYAAPLLQVRDTFPAALVARAPRAQHDLAVAGVGERVAVAWVETNDVEQERLRFRWLRMDGVSADAIEIATGERPTSIRVAANERNAAVVWNEASSVHAAVIDFAGSVRAVALGEGLLPSITTFGADYVLAWQRNVGGVEQIVVARLSSEGGVQPEGGRVLQASSVPQQFASITAKNGRLLIAYRARVDASSDGVFAVSSDSSLNALSGPLLVAKVEGDVTDTAAGDVGSGFGVAWTAELSGGVQRLSEALIAGSGSSVSRDARVLFESVDRIVRPQFAGGRLYWNVGRERWELRGVSASVDGGTSSLLVLSDDAGSVTVSSGRVISGFTRAESPYLLDRGLRAFVRTSAPRGRPVPR